MVKNIRRPLSGIHRGISSSFSGANVSKTFHCKMLTSYQRPNRKMEKANIWKITTALLIARTEFIELLEMTFDLFQESTNTNEVMLTESELFTVACFILFTSKLCEFTISRVFLDNLCTQHATECFRRNSFRLRHELWHNACDVALVLLMELFLFQKLRISILWHKIFLEY